MRAMNIVLALAGGVLVSGCLEESSIPPRAGPLGPDLSVVEAGRIDLPDEALGPARDFLEEVLIDLPETVPEYFSDDAALVRAVAEADG